MGHAASYSLRPPAAPPQPAAPARARGPHDPAVVGVEFLIEQAGGVDAVLQGASRKLRRVLRQANGLELREAIAMAFVELAPAALEQLGDGRLRALDAATQRVAQQLERR